MTVVPGTQADREDDLRPGVGGYPEHRETQAQKIRNLFRNKKEVTLLLLQQRKPSMPHKNSSKNS
jgi:hypothetical protein